MATPDILLNAVGSSAPSGKNPLETLSDVPFSGTDGSSFSAVMAEVSADARKLEEKAAEEEGLETGKGLPELPGQTPNRIVLNAMPLRSDSDTDQNLEEFAVGMGIDRELVRLLLSETAPVEAASGDTKVQDAPLPIVNPAIPSMSSAALPAPTMTDTAIAATFDQAVRPAVESETTIIGSTPVAGSTSVATSAPIADEDLLLWRSSLSTASSISMIEQPLVDESKTAVATSISIPASALTTEQLKTRGMPLAMPTTEADALNPVSLESAELRGSPSSIAVSSVALPEELGWRPRRFSFVNDPPAQSPSVSNADDGIAKADLGEFAEFLNSNSGFSAERGGEMPVRSAVTSGLVVAMGAESRPDTPFIGNISTASATFFATGTPQVAEATGNLPTLQTPDMKLSFGERVQAFADAVAQRVIGQIRDENWSVRLQLEPANLGAMDIDLSLTGNVVAATVGVANNDVRALLESGLPRLRESLESAGLQLSGWSFGQSGSRAFNDSARKFSQATFRGRIDQTESVAELDGSSMMPIRKAASGKIDLFV
ncbi:MAG: flagellar hook-length control protein FliK [Steroidobacteraceae bacterium]